VVARGEEEGSIGWPWQRRAGVGLARGWGFYRRWLRHSTWLHVGDSLPVPTVVEQRQSGAGHGGGNGGKGETFGPAHALYSRARQWSKAVRQR
jgi:hypothetical protein